MTSPTGKENKVRFASDSSSRCGIDTDSDVRRLLASCAYCPTDRVPNLEHYVMQRSMIYLLGEERVQRISRSDQMSRFRFLHSDTESEGEFREIERRWIDSHQGERYRVPWSSAGLPPEDNLDVLERTAVDAATPMLTWLPQVRKPYRTEVAAYDQNGVVKDWADMYKLVIPDGRVERMMQLVDWYLEVFSGTGIGVGPMCRSCFCNAYETLGLENFMLKLYDDRQLIERVMDVFTEYGTAITKGLSGRPIDCFWLDDDVAINSGFLVPPDEIRDLWVPRTELMLRPLREKGIPIYMHCCANVTDLLPIAAELGITAIHPVQPNCNDIVALKKRYQGEMAFVGNMDLAGVLSFGTPRQVMEDTRKHIEELAEGGGYVVASSHSITDDVPPENYLAMIEACQRYGTYAYPRPQRTTPASVPDVRQSRARRRQQ